MNRKLFASKFWRLGTPRQEEQQVLASGSKSISKPERDMKVVEGLTTNPTYEVILIVMVSFSVMLTQLTHIFSIRKAIINLVYN
jgi:hypothetical protein